MSPKTRPLCSMVQYVHVATTSRPLPALRTRIFGPWEAGRFQGDNVSQVCCYMMALSSPPIAPRATNKPRFYNEIRTKQQRRAKCRQKVEARKFEDDHPPTQPHRERAGVLKGYPMYAAHLGTISTPRIRLESVGRWKIRHTTALCWLHLHVLGISASLPLRVCAATIEVYWPGYLAESIGPSCGALCYFRHLISDLIEFWLRCWCTSFRRCCG